MRFWQTNMALTERSQGLPFQAVKHQVSTLDAQPTLEGGIMILVTGALLVRRTKHTPLREVERIANERGNL